MRVTYELSCPYCGHTEKISREASKHSEPEVWLCDNTGGGCDEYYVARLSCEITPQVRVSGIENKGKQL